VGRYWWDRFLYNQGARRLRAQLVGRAHTVVLDVPYRSVEGPAGGKGSDVDRSDATPVNQDRAAL
jgi:hypothetical protein